MKYFSRYKVLASLPCPVSNIRRVKLMSGPDASPESALLSATQECSEWNHRFWLNNNQRFGQFMAGMEGADEGQKAAAYRKYLAENEAEFRTYYRDWTRRNFALLWLDLRYRFDIVRRVFKRTSKSLNVL